MNRAVQAHGTAPPDVQPLSFMLAAIAAWTLPRVANVDLT
jgi:hypothetical protein